MSTREIDRVIARYLDGAMSPSEEEEFFVRMALDNELRQSYQAARVVESALHKQRQAAPRPTTGSRVHLMQSIATGDVVERSRVETTSMVRDETHRISTSPRQSPVLRWLRAIGAVATIGIAIMAIVVYVSDDKHAVSAPASVDSTASESQLPANAPPHRVDSTMHTEPAVTGASANVVAKPDVDDRAPVRGSPAAIVTHASRGQRNDDRNTATHANGTASQSSNATTIPPDFSVNDDATPRRPASRAGTTVDGARVDTIKLDVRVKMP